MKEIIHILMYKHIHKPIQHTQMPKMPRAFTCKRLWQSSNHHIQNFTKLSKHLERPLPPTKLVHLFLCQRSKSRSFIPTSFIHYTRLVTSLSFPQLHTRLEHLPFSLHSDQIQHVGIVKCSNFSSHSGQNLGLG